MKRAKKPKMKPRPPREQMGLFDEVTTFPLFGGGCPVVQDSPFRPRPKHHQPRPFGRPTVDELAQELKQ